MKTLFCKLIIWLTVALACAACGGAPQPEAPPEPACRAAFERCSQDPTARVSCIDGQCTCTIFASGIGAQNAGISMACRFAPAEMAPETP